MLSLSRALAASLLLCGLFFAVAPQRAAAQGSTEKLIGKWKLDARATLESLADDVDDELKAMFKEGGIRLSVEFLRDMTARTEVALADVKQRQIAEWKVTGESKAGLTLEWREKGENKIEEVTVKFLDSTGDTVEFSPPSGREKVVLVRVKEAEKSTRPR